MKHTRPPEGQVTIRIGAGMFGPALDVFVDGRRQERVQLYDTARVAEAIERRRREGVDFPPDEGWA